MSESEFEREHWEHGFPWCDTCKQPAVWSEWSGSLHSTPDHPFGQPKHLDKSGHEVTMREWWAAPSGQCGPNREADA